MPTTQAVGCTIDEVVAADSSLERAARSALAGRSYRGEARAPTGACFEVRGSPRNRADRSAGAIGVAMRAETTRTCPPEREVDRILGAMDHVPGAIWTTDLDMRLTMAIGRLRNGRKLSDFIGWTLQEFVGTSNPRDELLSHFRAVLKGERRAFRYQFASRCYEVVAEPRRDEHDDIIGSMGVAIDVTERQEAEQQLVESEARLAETQAVAHLGTWEWFIEADRVAWSEELYRIYGIQPLEFGGTFEAFLSCVYPEDVEPSRAVVLEALRTKSPFSVDHRIVRRDGAIRMLHTVGDVRLGANRSVERLVGCCWDVTDRWEATRKAEEAASLLRATLESTADGLLVVDREGRVRAHNRRFAQMWRLSSELVATDDDRTLLGSVVALLEDPKTFRERVDDLYARPDTESFDRVDLVDGRTFERYSKPQRLGDRIVGRVWSFRDVTERERLLRHALFLADASRLLASLDADPALEAVSRLAVASMAQACSIELFPRDGASRKSIARARDDRAPAFGDVPADVMSGRVVSYESEGRSRVAAPLRSKGGVVGAITFVAKPGVPYAEDDVALFEELARRIELSMENARLYREVHAALAAREDFLAIAAHEIRGPVTSLHLAAQMLQRPNLPDDAKRQSLSIITREDERLSRFVDELLDVARIRAGTMTFDLSRVNLTEVVRGVAQRLAPDLGRSGSALTISAPDRIEGIWDRSRLDQVVTNLLSNAIKFGLGRGIEIELSSTPSLARLAIRDHGIGIPTDRHDAVFRAFERAVSARNYGGLGLGLYIVHEIVSGLGGTIRLESEPGTGTTVSIELPRQRRGSR
jgi:signal transduction histidine kinase